MDIKERTEIWEIDKITGWDKNPRTVDKKGIERLKRQIRRFGQYKPIIVNINPDVAPVGAVAGGNMRLAAMRELGEKNVWVIPKHFDSEKEMIEISLSDNDRVGKYDEKGLVSLISGMDISLGDYSVDLRDPVDLDVIVANYGASGAKDDDAPDLSSEIKTKRGDLYQLGAHRLLCGDATMAEDWQALMGGAKARMIHTDPPYGVDYKSPSSFSYKSKKYRGEEKKILNDDLSMKELDEFYIKTLKNLFDFSVDDVTLYWWFANKNDFTNRQAFRQAMWHVSQEIIWIKNGVLYAHGQDYNRCHEKCMVGWKVGQKHYTNKNIANLKDVISEFKDNDEALKTWLAESFIELFDVWFQNRDKTKEYVHPTQKPVALAERAIKKNSCPGDIVVDAFLGSGSTLIACEKLSRRCYGCEIDNAYADVIIKRWMKFTGKQAIKIADAKGPLEKPVPFVA